jgi:hypothetical protein
MYFHAKIGYQSLFQEVKLHQKLKKTFLENNVTCYSSEERNTIVMITAQDFTIRRSVGGT